MSEERRADVSAWVRGFGVARLRRMDEGSDKRDIEPECVNGEDDRADAGAMLESGGTPVRMGDGLRFTYSWMASSAQVSRDLKEYLLDTLAMSMRWLRLAFAPVIILSSGGL